jgi:hypothetical protein
MTTKKPVATPKPATSTATTKTELKQIIKGLLLEMISDGTLPAAIKTYETLMEGGRQPQQQRRQTPQQTTQQHPGYITEQQRAAMVANAAYGNDPDMADIFADTLANAGSSMIEEQARLDSMMARQQQAPIPGMGEQFPRNMLPPRTADDHDESSMMLNEQQQPRILPNAPPANRWHELVNSKSMLPKPNRPGFLPGQR